MKTRNALFALCLPLAFAACQNEEFADLSNQGQALKNRGVVDVTITATRPDVNANTRMSSSVDANGINFLWEKDADKLGAALMDEVEAGTVNGANVYVNNPFIAQNDGASAEFKSPSSLTKGIYLFYNQYQDVLDRGALKLVMDTQEYDPSLAKTPVQQMASYMKMVAPMVNLNTGVGLEAAESFSLPLQFVNLYTPVKVPVMFKNAPAGTKLTRVSLNTTGNFVLGAKIAPTVLAGVGNANVLVLKNGKIDETKVAMADAIEALDAIVQKGTAAGIYDNGTAVRGAAVLDIKNGVELKNDEAMEFWVLIPRGTYTDLIINAETSNGNMVAETRTIAAPTDPTAVNPQVFDAKNRALKNVVIDFNDNVIQPTEFSIASGDDWTRYTQYVMDHVASYIGRDITFELVAGKTVYVTSLPQFGFTLKSATDAKVVLGASDKSAVSITADLSGVKMSNTPSVEVGEGAVVTVAKDAPAGNAFNLTNKGTLKLNVTTQATLRNEGTMNLLGDGTVASLTNKGTVNVNAEVTITALTNKVQTTKGTINVANGAALTLTDANSGKVSVAAGGVLTNVSGFTNSGEIDNSGELKVVATFSNGANGVIKVQDGSFSNNTQITNAGTVQVMNPTTYIDLTSSKKYKISGGTTTAVVSDRKAYLAAKGENMTITLGGSEWSLIEDAANSAETSKEIDDSEIAADLRLAANLTVKATSTVNHTILVTGNATIATATGASLTINGLQVASDVTATIAEGSKVYLPNTSAASAVDIDADGALVNNGTIAIVGYEDAITASNEIKGSTINQIRVKTDGSLTNKGTIGGELNTQMGVLVLGSMDNSEGELFGTVNVAGSQYWKKGTEIQYADLKVNKADLTEFAGANSVEAVTTAVTTLPAGTDVSLVRRRPAWLSLQVPCMGF